jgi:hypothetical protein
LKRLFRWFSRSDDQRIVDARRHLVRGRPDLARREVEGVTQAEAVALYTEAGTQLAARNLAAAVVALRRGDEAGAVSLVALADQLDPDGGADGFAEARRLLRELRAGRSDVGERTRADRETRVVAVDPLGFVGRSFQAVGAADRVSLDPAAEEITTRAAVIVDGYPPALRALAVALGTPFARALLDLEEGRPEHALPVLLSLPDAEAVVCWERARATDALGDPAAAAAFVRAFARLVGGHTRMGGIHSGVWLAELTVRAGDPAGALRTLRDVRATEPDAGAELFQRLVAQES